MALLTTMAWGGLRRAIWRFFAAWGIVLALLGAGGSEAFAQAPISAQNQLKAVFLFNFAQFVEWPANAFPEAKAPIVIGVLGDDPFGAYLDGLLQGEKIGERPMMVRRYRRVEDLQDCHILFVSRSESERLDKIVAQVKARNLLTVGDAEGFNRRGGMVRLATENGKIQLRINVVAVKAADLTISSRLLAHAVIVPPGKD